MGGCCHLQLAGVAATCSTRSGMKPQATNRNGSRNSAVHLGLHPQVEKCMHRQPDSLQKVRHIQPEAKKMGHLYCSTCRRELLPAAAWGPVCLTRTLHMHVRVTRSGSTINRRRNQVVVHCIADACMIWINVPRCSKVHVWIRTTHTDAKHANSM